MPDINYLSDQLEAVHSVTASIQEELKHLVTSSIDYPLTSSSLANSINEVERIKQEIASNSK